MASDVLDAVDLAFALNRLYTGNDAEVRLYRWVEGVTHRQPVFIRFTAASRASVVREIFKMEIQVLDLAVTRIRADVAALRPYEQESPEVQRAKLQAVHAAEAWLAHTAAAAREEALAGISLQPETSATDGGGSFQYTPGPAFHQLVHIAVNGWRGF